MLLSTLTMSSRSLSWFNPSISSSRRIVFVLFAAIGFAACGGDDADGEARCVASLPTSCTADFDPTFDAIYTNVVNQRCGTSDSGNTCHGRNGNAKSDLKLTDVDTAYRALLGQSGGAARVIPGDPHCSPLVERMESDDPAYRMPLGENKLSAGLRCAIQQWIEKGAPR